LAPGKTNPKGEPDALNIFDVSRLGSANGFTAATGGHDGHIIAQNLKNRL
jgi:hypothetical protein